MLEPKDCEIYHENDKVSKIYFLVHGKCGFVLSDRFNNFKYVNFTDRTHFGVIDIIGSMMEFAEDHSVDHVVNNWILYKERLMRHFNVATQEDS